MNALGRYMKQLNAWFKSVKRMVSFFFKERRVNETDFPLHDDPNYHKSQVMLECLPWIWQEKRGRKLGLELLLLFPLWKQINILDIFFSFNLEAIQ